jgi:hypothetical protein
VAHFDALAPAERPEPTLVELVMCRPPVQLLWWTDGTSRTGWIRNAHLASLDPPSPLL